MLLMPKADMATKHTYRFIAHETAHQWWGNIVAWRSYRDQWLSEGFAEYSGILYTGCVPRFSGKSQAGADSEGTPIHQGIWRSGGNLNDVFENLAQTWGSRVDAPVVERVAPRQR